MEKTIEALDLPERYDEIRRTLTQKPFLRKWYFERYRAFKTTLDQLPKKGLVLELGSGAGFIKEVIPEAITSDVITYEGVDQIVDATRLPFEDTSLRMIGMINVLHHISNAEGFFREASRCLVSGGRIFIVDQYVGYLSYWIYRYLHHEPMSLKAKTWDFPSTGPLSGANGALAKIIFYRDRALFEKKFPEFKILLKRPHSPLAYWLSGGLKKWTLVPQFLSEVVLMVDDLIARVCPQLCSFVDIQIEKRN